MKSASAVPATTAHRFAFSGSVLLLLIAFLSGTSALAQSHSGHGSHSTQTPTASQSSAATLSDGEVKKIDKGTGKVTISHGPIKNLGMPPMTMVFRVKDAGWIDAMQAGMKIRFEAETVEGALTIVRYEPVR